jgi:hypothetical protein
MEVYAGDFVPAGNFTLFDWGLGERVFREGVRSLEYGKDRRSDDVDRFRRCRSEGDRRRS